jgi:hypothetical protein
MTLAAGTCSREKQAHFQSRAHFFATAANLMRQIMVDHARGDNLRSVAADSARPRSTKRRQLVTSGRPS